MIYCPKCNAELVDDARFCMACGSPVAAAGPAQDHSQPAPVPESPPVQEYTPEPQYAAPAPEYAAAGTPAGYSQQNPSGSVYPFPNPAYSAPASYGAPPKTKGFPFKLVGILAGGAVVIGVIVFVLFSFVLGQGAKDSVLFLKDGEMNFTYVSKVDPFEVTSRLNNSGGGDEYAAYTVAYRTQISKNGRYIFYPDRQDSGQNGFSLYYKELSDAQKGAEGTKISSDVTSYELNTAGNKVYYLKGNNGGLYYYNLKESEKIDSDVQYFWMDDSGNKIVYLTNDGTIYQKTLNKDKVKIDSGSQVNYVSADLSKVYYLKDESLYLKAEGKDKEKLASGVNDFVTVYDSGEIYYIKSENNDLPLIDYVDDYLKDSDASTTRPDSSGYASWEDYYLDYAEYQKKLNRDQLRNNLETTKVNIAERTLFYYDGKTTFTVAAGLGDIQAYSWEKPVIVYSKYNKSEVTRLKIDEISNYSQVQQLVLDALTSSSDVYAAVKNTENFFQQAGVYRYLINYSATAIYFLDDFSDGTGDLHEAKINGNAIETPTIYAEEIDAYYYLVWGTDDIITFKDVDTSRSAGDLFLNNKFVDSDVYIYGVEEVDGTANLVYYVDWSDSSRSGTLKVYNGKNVTRITDDVHDALVLDEKTIAYLVDYNTSKSKGDAYLYNGSSKPQKIADDVTAFIRLY